MARKGDLLRIASGQLAASSGTILAGTSAPDTGFVTLLLANTSSTPQEIYLTTQTGSGTATRLGHYQLEQHEMVWLRNLPIHETDTLAGYTTTASVVDYTIFQANGGTMSVDVLGEDGTSKGVAVLRKILLGMEVLTDADLTDPGS